MAFCSFTSPVPCHQQLIDQGGIKARICSFFDWNIGKKDRPQPKYHEVDLPFPTSLVKTTFLAGRELRCCYKAAVDGFSAMDFHGCCNFKGPCVVIGYTDGSFKFGAFNPEGYWTTDDCYDTFDAFLFYWKDADNGELVTLPKVGGNGAALFDYGRGGPQFGADGLLIGPPLAPVMGGFAWPDTNSRVEDLRRGLDCLMLRGKMGKMCSAFLGLRACSELPEKMEILKIKCKNIFPWDRLKTSSSDSIAQRQGQQALGVTHKSGHHQDKQDTKVIRLTNSTRTQ